jgi:hypothetical protein
MKLLHSSWTKIDINFFKKKNLKKISSKKQKCHGFFSRIRTQSLHNLSLKLRPECVRFFVNRFRSKKWEKNPESSLGKNRFSFNCDEETFKEEEEKQLKNLSRTEALSWKRQCDTICLFHFKEWLPPKGKKVAFFYSEIWLI